ncbi:MAG: TonB-dependent receptor, partial [Bacteroidota bacterium]
PSVYVTKQGGGFGDARINVRGFDQSNTAVMINGIPVNDMENGWVYWSNWAGLSDVSSQIQIQRGLGASKLAVPSIGGSINIVTNAADMKRGGVASVSIGNDGFQKYGLSYSTGLNDKGWAFTAQATHTQGNGYVDGTKFRAYSYFANLTKNINDKHTLSLTAVGAPQWHHQRTVGRFDGVTLRTYIDPDDPQNLDASTGRGIRYNHLWGELDGEEFSFRRNFYHKPKTFLNHYWNISPKTDLKTSVYASFGLGGGTGPRGRITSGPDGTIFDSSSRIRNEEGQILWDDIVSWQGGNGGMEETWGEKEIDPEFDGYTTTSRGNGFIRRASMNYHNWYGVLSTLTHELGDNLNLIAGIDGRYYKGIHFRRLENLLGLDAYLSRANDNNPTNYITETAPANFGNFWNNSFQDGTNVLNYYNDGLVSWAGLFAQLEYTTDKLSAFASGNVSNQGFKRIDYFNYLEDDAERETDWQNFLGGNIKAGANYNLDDKQNVFVNAGYASRQPLFDNVFLNFRNDINEDVENQTFYSFEAGYGFRAKGLRANINVYHTNWGNRQFEISEENELEEELSYVFQNVEQLHQGLELEIDYKPINRLQLDGMLSLGNWRYNKNFTGTGTNIDTNEDLGEISIFAEGLPIGDAAQTTFSIGATYEIISSLRVYADYTHFDRLFALYDVQDAQFLSEGGQIAQVPSYGLMDAGASYNFELGGLNCTFNVNVNNVLDNTYIAELHTNILDDASTPDVNEFYNNRGFFGFGRTWNAGLKVRF